MNVQAELHALSSSGIPKIPDTERWRGVCVCGGSPQPTLLHLMAASGKSRETFAWEFPPPPCRDGAHPPLPYHSLPPSLSPLILPHTSGSAAAAPPASAPSIPASRSASACPGSSVRPPGDATAAPAAFRRGVKTLRVDPRASGEGGGEGGERESEREPERGTRFSLGDDSCP